MQRYLPMVFGMIALSFAAIAVDERPQHAVSSAIVASQSSSQMAILNLYQRAAQIAKPSKQTLDWWLARREQLAPEMNLEQYRAALLDAWFARALTLQAAPELALRNSQVGYSSQYLALKLLAGFSADPVVNCTLQVPELSQTLDKPNMLGELDAQQQSKAQQLLITGMPALTASLAVATQAESEQVFSLWTFYQWQSVQGRARLFNHDQAWFAAELQQICQWQQLSAKRQAQGLDELALLTMAHAVQSRGIWQSYLGVNDDSHHPSPMHDALSAELSDSQLQVMLSKQPLTLTQTAKVTANGALFSEQAQLAYLRGLRGSTAPNDWPTDGVFTAVTEPDWLHAMVFNLPLGLTKPLRTPDGQWLVLDIQDIRKQTVAAEAETARYLARQHWVKQQAKQRYEQAKQQWLASVAARGAT